MSIGGPHEVLPSPRVTPDVLGMIRDLIALGWSGRSAVGDHPERKQPNVPAVFATALAASIRSASSSVSSALEMTRSARHCRIRARILSTRAAFSSVKYCLGRGAWLAEAGLYSRQMNPPMAGAALSCSIAHA